MNVPVARKIQCVVCGRREVVYTVGEIPSKNGLCDGEVAVKEIGEKESRGPGDPWFYDVVLMNNAIIRVFDMDEVILTSPVNFVLPEKKLIIS